MKFHYIKHAFSLLLRLLQNYTIRRSQMGFLSDGVTPLSLRRISKIGYDWFGTLRSRSLPWVAFGASVTYNTNNVEGANLHGIPRAYTTERTKTIRHANESRAFPYCDTKCTDLSIDTFIMDCKSILVNSVFIQTLINTLPRKTHSRSLCTTTTYIETFTIRTLCGSFEVELVYNDSMYKLTFTSAHFPVFTRVFPPGTFICIVPTPCPVLFKITPILNESYRERDFKVSTAPVDDKAAPIMREYSYTITYDFLKPYELKHVLSILTATDDIFYMYHRNNPSHKLRW